jgi:hypothetical protein
MSLLAFLWIFLFGLLPLSKWWEPMMRGFGMWSRTYDELDHGKFWSVVLVAVVCIAHFAGNPFAVAMVIALMSGVFGRAVWSRFLESKTVTVQRTERDERVHKIDEQVKRTIEERRVVAEGFEPTEE